MRHSWARVAGSPQPWQVQLDAQAAQRAQQQQMAPVLNLLFGALGVKNPSQSLNPPIQKPYQDTSEYEKYVLDLDQVNTLMTGDGWKTIGEIGPGARLALARAYARSAGAGGPRRL